MDNRLSDQSTLILLIVLLIITGSAILFISFETREAIKDAVRSELTSVSTAIATQINGDVLASLQPGDENTPGYLQIRDTLHTIQENNPDIRYIYTMRRVDDHMEFIVDGDYGYAANAAPIGKVYPKPNNEMLQGLAGPSADTDFTTDEWGTVLSGYYPIHDRNGNVIGLVGVDMERGEVIERQNFLNIGFYLLILIAILLVAIGILWVEIVRQTGDLQVREREQKFRMLAESTTSGIFIIQNEAFTYINPAFTAITGYTLSDLSGTPFWRIIHPRHQDFFRQRSMGHDPASPNPLQYEIQLIHKNGEERWIEVSAGPIMYQGRPAIIGTIYDISDLTRSEHALQEANTKLNLMSSITRHDINNSLTSLLGYLDLLKDACHGPPGDGYIGKMEIAASAIRAQIDFTKVYQELGIQAPEWQNLDAVVRSAGKNLLAAAVSLEIHLSNLEIYADPLLERVFYNLIENTLRHSGTATAITLNAREEYGSLVIEYEDNGKGIPEDDKDIIFQRGYGVNTGFGLFIAREILSITGITIRECGTFGKGVKFEISVPKGMYRSSTDKID